MICALGRTWAKGSVIHYTSHVTTLTHEGYDYIPLPVQLSFGNEGELTVRVDPWPLALGEIYPAKVQLADVRDGRIDCVLYTVYGVFDNGQFYPYP